MARLVPARSAPYPNILDYTAYTAVHVIALGAFWTGVSWRAVAICGISYFIRQFGLMGGNHRYFSHRSYKTSRPMQFVLAILGTLGMQKGVLWWASLHRHHHRYSDTEHDIHSPIHRGFLYSFAGWFLDPRHRGTDYTRVSDLTKYPELIWLNEWNFLVVVVFGVGVYLGLGFEGVVWGFGVSTALIWHSILLVGTLCHISGERRFITADNSRNRWFLGVLTLGEGHHNNHHYYPSSARLGLRWWEIDPAWMTLKLLSWCGLVWDLRTPPAEHLDKRAPGDQATVKRFEAWLLELRYGLRRQIEEHAPADDNRDVFAHVVDDHLDAFDRSALDHLARNPMRLSDDVVALRRELAAHAEGHPALLELHRAPVAAALDQQLDEALGAAPFTHLLDAGRRAA